MRYDKLVDSTVLDGAMTATADAIRGKTDSADKIPWDEATGFAAAVEAILTRQEPVEEKDVNFYDYDGTCLYAYTIAEAQALTELPPGPTHEGLVFQGWNWTLEQVTALQFPMDIGALYTTDDGWSRFYLDILREIEIEFYFFAIFPKDITLDWGDGSATETPTSSGYNSHKHTYAPGKYVLRVFDKAGFIRFGNGGGPTNIFNKTYTTASNTLYKAEIAAGSRLTSAFSGCARLKTVSIPDGCEITRSTYIACPNLAAAIFTAANKEIGISMFESGNPKVVSIPPTVATINTQAFRYANGLRSIKLPEGITTFGSRAFEQMRGLRTFLIPSTVTSIGSYAYLDLTNLAVLRFLPTTPPTVANANAFTSIPTTCIVEVPAESLEAYQNATNYSGIAAQMVGV